MGRKWKFQVINYKNIIYRMKRGVDESAIESMAEAADPVIYSRSNSEFIEMKKE